MHSRLLAVGLALVLACAAVPVMAAAPGNEAEWTRAVQRRLISRLEYPEEAHRLSGPISLSLKITALRNGAIYDVVVSRSSGDAAVDQAAVAMVRRAGPLPAFPDAMTQEKTEPCCRCASSRKTTRRPPPTGVRPPTFRRAATSMPPPASASPCPRRCASAPPPPAADTMP
ncbi:TonB family protein [Achromobacter insuavis]